MDQRPKAHNCQNYRSVKSRLSIFYSSQVTALLLNFQSKDSIAVSIYMTLLLCKTRPREEHNQLYLQSKRFLVRLKTGWQILTLILFKILQTFLLLKWFFWFVSLNFWHHAISSLGFQMNPKWTNEWTFYHRWLWAPSIWLCVETQPSLQQLEWANRFRMTEESPIFDKKTAKFMQTNSSNSA